MAARQSYAQHGRQSYAPTSYASRNSAVAGSSAPRASTFPVPSSDYLNSIEECVKATEGCASTLGKAITNFQPGVADLPRLSKVLNNQHHFLVFTAPAVARARAAHAASLSPQMDALLARAESLVQAERAHLDRLEERLALMHEAAQRRQLPAAPRLPGTFRDLDTDDDAVAALEDNKSRLEGVDLKDITLAQRRRIGLLRNKRDKLDKERARLAAVGV